MKGKTALNEVVLRRIISAIYLSLFNYWSLKNYHKGARGEGPLQDSFWYASFHEDLLKRGLDHAIYTIYLYRVAADHYVLNPTKVALTSKPWKGKEMDVEISEEALKRVLEAACDILNMLEQY